MACWLLVLALATKAAMYFGSTLPGARLSEGMKIGVVPTFMVESTC